MKRFPLAPTIPDWAPTSRPLGQAHVGPEEWIGHGNSALTTLTRVAPAAFDTRSLHCWRPRTIVVLAQENMKRGR